MEMTTLVTKLLGPAEDVEPSNYFLPRLHRWMIFETQHFKVYLQHIHNEDLEAELRAYGDQFISFGVASSDRRNSAATPNAVPDRAAWMVLIAKPPRQK
ncbi:MAG: hypothetical protein WA653_21875 [Candidatus Sulfotelmatobacter sp.]